MAAGCCRAPARRHGPWRAARRLGGLDRELGGAGLPRRLRHPGRVHPRTRGLLAVAPVSQVSTYAYVNPVVAVALGAVLRDEQADGP
jgi:hypothetical protein